MELGKVNWLRNLEEARATASIKGKPILILFQEIPGCLTCKQYGRVVLSHPLIVETIETYFVPLAIYNNRKGPDESVLAFYQEPSWNNPVVRIVGENKKDILPRLNGQYTPSALVGYMIEGLKKTGNEIPPYLSLLHDDLQAEEKGKEKVTLSMYCFWTGERALGSLDGVMETEAGFMDGHEVVNVYYDPQKISLQTVIKRGKASRCADAVYLNQKGDKQGIASFFKPDQIRKEETFRLDREPKYYMGKTLFALLPMTTVQSVKINALLGSGKQPCIFCPPGKWPCMNISRNTVSLRGDHP